MIRSKAIIIIFCFLLLAIGFAIGTNEVFADSEEGIGSEDDPVVTESYIDSVVDDKFKQIEQDIEELQARVDELEEDVEDLR